MKLFRVFLPFVIISVLSCSAYGQYLWKQSVVVNGGKSIADTRTVVKYNLFQPAVMRVPKKVVLFDGSDMSSFCGQKNDESAAPTAWTIDGDGNLHFKKEDGSRGNLFVKGEFANFVLHWDWKVGPGCNSGVKYHLTEYGNNNWMGPEYQVLDDSRHGDGKNPKTSSAALYHIFPAGENKQLQPVGEFNHSMIVVRGNRGEHWLNGKKVLDYKIGSSEWIEAIKKSKFNNIANYAENKSGRIHFQDHNDEVWYRNIWLEDLDHFDEVPVMLVPRPFAAPAFVPVKCTQVDNSNTRCIPFPVFNCRTTCK